jgi:hypothetical protein
MIDHDCPECGDGGPHLEATDIGDQQPYALCRMCGVRFPIPIPFPPL